VEINKNHDEPPITQPSRCQIRKKPTTPKGTSGWRTSTHHRNWTTTSKSTVLNHLLPDTPYLNPRHQPLRHPDRLPSPPSTDPPPRSSKPIRLPLLRLAHLDPSPATRPLHPSHIRTSRRPRHLHTTRTTSLPRLKPHSPRIPKANPPRKTTTTNRRLRTAKALAPSNPLHI
jgi:hypothetical protein